MINDKFIPKQVVCIDNRLSKEFVSNRDLKKYELTVGKIYYASQMEIFRHDEYSSYRIVDDLGRNYWYSFYLFKDLSDVRDEKIDQIINT